MKKPKYTLNYQHKMRGMNKNHTVKFVLRFTKLAQSVKRTR